MDFGPEPVEMSAFAEMHKHLSTSPDSGFVQVTTVQWRDATGADVLRGLVLTRVGNREDRLTVETSDDYFALLADVFGLTLDDVAPAERAALRDRLVAAHEVWRKENGS